MDKLSKFASFFVLLAGSVFFGYLGRPTEMGLTIVAGALGLAFSNIDKISEFGGGGFFAKMKGLVDPIVAKETEPDSEAEEPRVIEARALISDMEKRAIRALASTKYAYRNVSALSEELQCSRQTVYRVVSRLQEQGIAVSIDRANGRVWGLTELGRALLKNIDEIG